jgi:hypothetical protein
VARRTERLSPYSTSIKNEWSYIPIFHTSSGYEDFIRPGIAVGIATGCGLNDRGIGVPVGSRIFYFSITSRPALELTQIPSQWVPGAFSSWVKRQEREADH